MTEISREEAINDISDFAVGTNQEVSNLSLSQAISDMKKLEKIEQELNYDCRTDESINCLECKPKYDRGCNSCLETRRLEKIEQILKGGEE